MVPGRPRTGGVTTASPGGSAPAWVRTAKSRPGGPRVVQLSLCRTATVPLVEQLALTPKMAAVIKVFLEDPLKPRYGLELMRLTRQPSGTLYPILARLERAGWLAGSREDIDPHAEGRPPRRVYHVTSSAVAVARTQLAALSEQYRPPAPVRPHLAPNGSTP
jgi:PadR family transcriptional regulator PadR